MLEETYVERIEREIEAFLRVIKRRRWFVVVIVIIVGIGSIAYLFQNNTPSNLNGSTDNFHQATPASTSTTALKTATCTPIVFDEGYGNSKSNISDLTYNGYCPMTVMKLEDNSVGTATDIKENIIPQN